ncbi:MAG: FHA domain-containing protein, partial [Rhizobacter sp.]
MNLVIQAHTLKNEPLSQPITGRFDERGGTIGRSDTNTLALPDPERHISRLHAEVWFSNGAFSIRNVGSANAILVNGRPIAPGEGSAVNEGDELVIGAYAMRVTFNVPTQSPRTAVDGRTVIRSSAGESRTNPPQARPVQRPTTTPMPPAFTPQPPPPAPAASAADPFADLFGAAPAAPASSDPFADLLG